MLITAVFNCQRLLLKYIRCTQYIGQLNVVLGQGYYISGHYIGLRSNNSGESTNKPHIAQGDLAHSSTEGAKLSISLSNVTDVLRGR